MTPEQRQRAVFDLLTALEPNLGPWDAADDPKDVIIDIEVAASAESWPVVPTLAEVTGFLATKGIQGTGGVSARLARYLANHGLVATYEQEYGDK